MCPDWESNLRPLGLWDNTQPTEPHQPRHFLRISKSLHPCLSGIHCCHRILMPFCFCSLVIGPVFFFLETWRSFVCLYYSATSHILIWVKFSNHFAGDSVKHFNLKSHVPHFRDLKKKSLYCSDFAFSVLSGTLLFVC